MLLLLLIRSYHCLGEKALEKMFLLCHEVVCEASVPVALALHALEVGHHLAIVEDFTKHGAALTFALRLLQNPWLWDCFHKLGGLLRMSL